MKKVHQLLNKENPVKGEVGLEIECEGKNLREIHEGGWRSESDGSLRGRYPETAAEYVLDEPIKAKEVEKYVANLVEYLEGAKFDFNFRTSVHVHINVQDLTEAEVCNFTYAYLLLEEPLTNFCGRDRKGNRFCLRVQDAEQIVGYVREMCEQGVGRAMRWDQNAVRYSAINLAALQKYGSIEFRAMRGNIDPNTIHIWANSLNAIKEYAQTKKQPSEIREEFEKLGPSTFLQKVLGEYAGTYKYPRAIKEMQRSYSLSLEIPYSYKEVKEKEIPEPIAMDGKLEFYNREFNRPQNDIIHTRIFNKQLQVKLKQRDAVVGPWVGVRHATPEDFIWHPPVPEEIAIRPKAPRKPVELDF